MQAALTVLVIIAAGALLFIAAIAENLHRVAAAIEAQNKHYRVGYDRIEYDSGAIEIAPDDEDLRKGFE